MNPAGELIEPNDEPQQKRQKTDSEIETELESFLSWCKSSGIIINEDSVKISRMGMSHNYGMVAIKDIEAHSVLAQISRKAVLEPGTTNIKDLLKKSILI